MPYINDADDALTFLRDALAAADDADAMENDHNNCYEVIYERGRDRGDDDGYARGYAEGLAAGRAEGNG